MSNLTALVWTNDDDFSDFKSRSLTHRYSVVTDGLDKFKVAYYRLSSGARTKYATGFANIDEAKEWCWNHYNEKMQPYVKPMPTWIDVNKRFPEQNAEVLVRYHAHFDDEEIKEFDFCTAFFYGKSFDVKDQNFYTKRTTSVTHWMPIPKFSTMQNNKGE